jgi:hypothetical protein
VSVAAKIAGLDGISGLVERGGEAGIAPGVLGEAVDDLDDAPGRAIREPKITMKGHAVRRGKDEGGHRKG